MTPGNYLEVSAIFVIWTVLEKFLHGDAVSTIPEWKSLLSMSITFAVLAGITWGFKQTTKRKR